MSSRLGLREWELRRRAFEGRSEALLMDQQRIFRLAQALSRKELAPAVSYLEAGVALDLPLVFEGAHAAPGADRFRPEALQEMPTATLLAIFVAQGDLMVCNWLLQHGADPSQVFADNRDAAWAAMLSGQEDLHGRLLAMGASSNLRLSDGSGRTRLMAATALSNATLVEQILQRRGNAKAYDARGRTALHLNMEMSPYTDQDMRIGEMLLAAGASPNAEDLAGVPPHLLATEPAARSVLEGHELTVKSDAALAAHLAEIEAQRELEADTDAPSVPGVDPAEPDIPQIQRKPQKFRPKPPRL